MRQRVFISIHESSLQKLALIAANERREVRAQAAVMLENAIALYRPTTEVTINANTGATDRQASSAGVATVNP